MGSQRAMGCRGWPSSRRVIHPAANATPFGPLPNGLGDPRPAGPVTGAGAGAPTGPAGLLLPGDRLLVAGARVKWVILPMERSRLEPTVAMETGR